jgi:hypothetical protein
LVFGGMELEVVPSFPEPGVFPAQTTATKIKRQSPIQNKPRPPDIGTSSLRISRKQG